MKRRIVSAVAAAIASGLGFVGPASSADNFDYCLVCHGDNGNGNAAIHAPKISGLEPWYIARQLEAFASGARGTVAEDAPGHEMGPVGMRLKKEGKIDAAVRFVSSLKSAAPTPTVSGDVDKGRQIYGTCAGCHGLAGEGMPDMKAPALASRTDWYLMTQLSNFKQGLRGGDTADIYGAQMRAVATTLPDDKAIADVAAYINTLKGE